MITTLTGENDVLRGQALHAMVDVFIAEYGDMAVERLDGEEVSYERIHEAAQSSPFLVRRKLLVLRVPGANKEFIEKLEQILDDIAETNDVVIVEPKLDKRLSYYKQLKKLTDFHEFVVLDGNSLAVYLTDYTKRQGGSLSVSDARILIDRIGVNQLTLQHEVDKLLAYDPRITYAGIELLVERTPQSSIFELLDAAFAGDAKRAAALYTEQRALHIEPQQILAMLIWQLHILAIIKTAGTRTTEAIAKEAKISPFTVRKSQGLGRCINVLQLKQHLQTLREFDTRLKRESLNADEVVRYYLLNLAIGN